MLFAALRDYVAKCLGTLADPDSAPSESGEGQEGPGAGVRSCASTRTSIYRLSSPTRRTMT